MANQRISPLEMKLPVMNTLTLLGNNVFFAKVIF